MIVEISEMNSLLSDFIHDANKKEIIVGSIAGTEIEKYVLDAVTEVYDFKKVLILNGCQDYIGMMTNPLPNVMYYGDVLNQEYIDPPRNMTSPWISRLEQPEPFKTEIIDVNKINKYDAVVVFNSQLTNITTAKRISEAAAGPVIFVIDAVEGRSWVFGMDYASIPVISDTLIKVPPIIAMARRLVGFDTRHINTKAKGTVNEVEKMNQRSIGKLDDKQYVSEDYELINLVRDKQYNAPLRKNQKLVVTTDIDIMLADDNTRQTLTADSMLVVDNANSRPLQRFRLYNSKIMYASRVIYNKTYNRFLNTRTDVQVEPGNIIYGYQFKKHRFNHTVFINSTNHYLNDVDKYSLLKNSINLTIVKSWK